MKWTDYIVTNQNVGFGKPIIKGTRLSVEFILGLLASGWTEKQILENYPSLKKEHLTALYSYLNEMIKDELFFDFSKKSAS